ncbi:MAG: OmpA family protein [Paludibacteraceae bacterium]|nr:OmpA family protein [Paludibacteraceae bacterium]
MRKTKLFLVIVSALTVMSEMVYSQQSDNSFVSAGALPYDTIETDTTWQYLYRDTTFTIHRQTITHVDTIEVQEEEAVRDGMKGHNFQFMVGGGYGTLGYQLGDAGSVKGSVSSIAQLQYAYYWNAHWGFSLGLGFSHYMSTATLNNCVRFSNIKDSEGEPYTHQVLTQDWKERQLLGLLSVPVNLQMQYPVSQTKKHDRFARFYMTFGVMVGLPVWSQYKLLDGGIEHQGVYDRNVTLYNMPSHGYYKETIGEDFDKDNHKMSPKSFDVLANLEMGFAIPCSRNVDFLIGAYANYSVIDIQGNADQIGWQQHRYAGLESFKNHTFMNDYAGVTNSDLASNERPWAAGLKIGVQWHNRPKTQQHKTYEEVLSDTTFAVSQRSRIEHKPIVPVAVQQIREVMKKTYIWFEFDSYIPKFSNGNPLDKVAEILRANPDQRILITGHASKEGQLDHNLQLAENRAKMIASLLIGKGVKKAQIDCEGRGVSTHYQKDYQDTDEGRELDRRVEINPIVEYK